MAVAKKRKTVAKRKTTAKRKTASVKGLPQRKKYGDKTYSKSTCSQSKADATKKAKAHRASGKGKLARIAKDPKTGKYCVFTYR